MDNIFEKGIPEKERKNYRFHFDNFYMEHPQLYDSIILYQIGDLSCEEGYEIGEHKQICYEISYIVSGKGVYRSNNNEYRVKKGDIYLSLPDEIHNGIADTIDPFRYFYVGFNFVDSMNDANLFTNIKKIFDQIKRPLIQDKLDIEAPFINIFNELINLNEFSSVMLKTYLYQIVILVYRCFSANWEKEYSQQENSEKSKRIVYVIVNLIDTNLHKIKNLSDIADVLGYSYSHISRIFSTETGLSIQEYYNKKRFEKAISWLKKSELSITDIAENLNYQTIHSFSKAFRKNFGISPTQYQALYKRNE